tara:strand:+ start:15948 stop:17075 length:1128 start_codon:yes stop_codon:yes gene_type:complete
MKKTLYSLILIFIAFISVINTYATEQNQDNLWNQILQSSTWDKQYLDQKIINSPIIQNELKKISRSPGYFETISKRAEPFLYHIISELKKRSMPLEIALLPILESGYNPKAHSHKGAHGIWQLIPSTAKYLGLKTNIWYDDRRNILTSTDAALNYLNKINKEFNNNWILSLAAYNAGSGTVRSAIRRNKKQKISTLYWDLPLPLETKKYAPKFLAILIALKNPTKYNQKLPFIANKKFFSKVNFPKQTNILAVAKKNNIDANIIKVLNNHYPRFVTAPQSPNLYGASYVLVPEKHDKNITKNVKKPSYNRIVSYNKNTDKSWSEYIIKPGESLSNIAKNLKISMTEIKNMNNIIDIHKIKTGMKLNIPISTQIIN